jgi:hypothetical protein
MAASRTYVYTLAPSLDPNRESIDQKEGGLGREASLVTSPHALATFARFRTRHVSNT